MRSRTSRRPASRSMDTLAEASPTLTPFTGRSVALVTHGTALLPQQQCRGGCRSEQDHRHDDPRDESSTGTGTRMGGARRRRGGRTVRVGRWGWVHGPLDGRPDAGADRWQRIGVGGEEFGANAFDRRLVHHHADVSGGGAAGGAHRGGEPVDDVTLCDRGDPVGGVVVGGFAAASPRIREDGGAHLCGAGASDGPGAQFGHDGAVAVVEVTELGDVVVGGGGWGEVVGDGLSVPGDRRRVQSLRRSRRAWCAAGRLAHAAS